MLSKIAWVLIIVAALFFIGCDDCSEYPPEVTYDTTYLDTLYLDTFFSVDTLYDTIYKDTLRDTIVVEEEATYSYLSPSLYRGFGGSPSLYYYRKTGVYTTPFYPGDIDYRYYGSQKYWFFRTNKYKMAHPY